jgi:nucleoside-diphosphate-sugar epimerase
MRKEVVLITGANGEIGHGLIAHLGENKNINVVAMDIQPLDDCLRCRCVDFIQGDILDASLFEKVAAKYDIRTIFHLASILSTKAEKNPELAHHINVDGTLNILHLASAQSASQGRPVKVIYPSSIAVYGMPDLKVKAEAGKVKEDDFLKPITMYGCNKLYCEHLGRYFTNNYRQMETNDTQAHLDFRCLRFPGLVSSVTVPTGGTSDYGPEMLHHAAQGIAYPCFVRADSRLPFMVMPDAVKSLLELEAAPQANLKQLVYNVTSFSPTAMEFNDRIKLAFPKAEITFEPHKARQGIVDSWPADIDDSAATRDWGWHPDYDIERSFDEYLIPSIKARYSK